MAYDKYKKIKDNPNRKAKLSGLENANNYVDDKEKTRPKGSAPEDDEAVRSIAAISDYAENEMKVINPENYRSLVSGINCDGQDFVSLCNEADDFYHQHHDEHLSPGQVANQGFHVINSFKGHPDPELVHRAGIELARRLCGDEFYGKVCTHLNTDNYHNHIVIGAYSIDGTHKFKDEWHLYRKIRQISNEISLEYGLDIITAKGTDRRSWSENFQHDKFNEVRSVTQELKESINDARKDCGSFDEFLKRMQADGWEIQQRKNTVIYSKGDITLSDSRLGNRYTKRGIEESIARDAEQRMKRKIASDLRHEMAREEWRTHQKLERIYVPRYSKNGFRLPRIIRLLILVKRLLQLIGDKFFNAAIAEQMPSNLRTASAAEKIARIDEAIDLCIEYNISTKQQLEDAIKRVGMNSKSKDFEATRLYQAADLMSDYVEDLKRYDDLKLVMDSLGIDAADFALPAFSEDEIAQNMAAFDPMSGKLRKQLFNAISASDYALPRNAYKKLTREDAESILDFLHEKSTAKPEILLDKAQAERENAQNNITKRLNKRNQMLYTKYHSEPATPRQIAAIKAGLSKEQRERINPDTLMKDEAIRLMQLLNTTKPVPEYTADPADKPNDYLLNSIRDLKIIYPELKDIQEEKLSSASANNISNYYLSRQDTLLNATPAQKKKRPKLDLSTFSEEEKSFIYENRNILDITNRFGLDTPEKVHDFIAHYNDIITRADNFSAEARDFSYDYRELKQLERLMKQLTSPAFVYGTMYEGKAEELEAAIRTIGDDQTDDLIFLRDEISERIDDLRLQNPQPVELSSEHFTPPDFVTINTLIRLHDVCPEYFRTESDEDINLSVISDYDALQILERIEKSQVLDKEIDRLTALEKRREENEHEAQNEEEKRTEEATEREIERVVDTITKSRNM